MLTDQSPFFIIIVLMCRRQQNFWEIHNLIPLPFLGYEKCKNFCFYNSRFYFSVWLLNKDNFTVSPLFSCEEPSIPESNMSQLTVFQEQIKSGRVPEVWPEPVKVAGTLAPHFCGFNPFTRQCMDPEHLCPGRCMNFQYIFNSRYDCRCLVV